MSTESGKPTRFHQISKGEQARHFDSQPQGSNISPDADPTNRANETRTHIHTLWQANRGRLQPVLRVVAAGRFMGRHPPKGKHHVDATMQTLFFFSLRARAAAGQRPVGEREGKGERRTGKGTKPTQEHPERDQPQTETKHEPRTPRGRPNHKPNHRRERGGKQNNCTAQSVLDRLTWI